MKKNKIIYIQYTNPAGYPPLEHSSKILADLGWWVRFLGIEALGSKNLIFPEHEKISIKILKGCAPGWQQKLHYLRFNIWVITQVILFRPQAIYLSDLFSCPAGLLLSFLSRAKIIYHEHDSPNADSNRGVFTKWLLWTRQQLAAKALLIFPNEDRGKLFVNSLPQKDINFMTVWNFPILTEASLLVEKKDSKTIYLAYFGSINQTRLPKTLLQAMTRLPDNVKLKIIGYETIGSRGYMAEFLSLAEAFSISERIDFLGSMSRKQALEALMQCHIGIAFIPKKTNDINMRYMLGASNKPFDYLACGMALLISDLPEWKVMYEQPNYGLSCHPEDSESIANAINALLADVEKLEQMGEAGRARILQEWHYEKQFQPVLKHIDTEL